MKSVQTLKDIGRNRDCIIIGGGNSLNYLDLEKLPDDMYIISINNHYPELSDMIIYYDKDMQLELSKRILKPNQLLLGFKHSTKLDHTNVNCTHYYDYKDMIFGDSGFHAVQFADLIFNFKNIYLAGYDYQIKGSSYHHNEIESDHIKLARFQKWSIGKVLSKYKLMTWKNNIYNCYADSSLKVFKHKLPY